VLGFQGRQGAVRKGMVAMLAQSQRQEAQQPFQQDEQHHLLDQQLHH
jgi:hypothetical protein